MDPWWLRVAESRVCQIQFRQCTSKGVNLGGLALRARTLKGSHPCWAPNQPECPQKDTYVLHIQGHNMVTLTSGCGT